MQGVRLSSSRKRDMVAKLRMKLLPFPTSKLHRNIHKRGTA